jgi:hypothetical protein
MRRKEYRKLKTLADRTCVYTVACEERDFETPVHLFLVSGKEHRAGGSCLHSEVETWDEDIFRRLN